MNCNQGLAQMGTKVQMQYITMQETLDLKYYPILFALMQDIEWYTEHLDALMTFLCKFSFLFS